VAPERIPGVNAWIACMRGCDNFCTFCVVPYTRGRERSRDAQGIVEETRQLVAQGFKQVTLLGQNVNSYRHEGSDFGDLLRRVADVPGIERVRFTSPHPKDFPDSLLGAIASHDKICSHIHLPLQAGSTRILEEMRRTYSKQEFLDLVDKIRDTIPDICLTTDIICGFPSESEVDFEDTVEVVDRVRFDSAFVFKYSERKNTIAQRKFADDVPDAVKVQRVVRLNEIQKAITLRQLQRCIGQTLDVLLEAPSRRSPDDLLGRDDGFRSVVVPRGHHEPGDMVRVTITAAASHTLLGRIIESAARPVAHA
jgi:tRNA-2-methylthio-N6-dimethylallyladenosine synthase